jgi:hypothetical protein
MAGKNAMVSQLARVPPGVEEPRTKAVAIVEFKRGRKAKYEAEPALGLQVGTFVIVDGDRGVDCGLMVQLALYTWDGIATITELEGSNSTLLNLQLEPGSVRRVATTREIESLHTYVPLLEQQALNLFRLRCKTHGFASVRVHDCEFQFDGKKITFFYEHESMVDFRELVREMYSIYQARIWLENTNAALILGDPKLKMAEIAAIKSSKKPTKQQLEKERLQVAARQERGERRLARKLEKAAARAAARADGGGDDAGADGEDDTTGSDGDGDLDDTRDTINTSHTQQPAEGDEDDETSTTPPRPKTPDPLHPMATRKDPSRHQAPGPHHSTKTFPGEPPRPHTPDPLHPMLTTKVGSQPPPSTPYPLNAIAQQPSSPSAASDPFATPVTPPRPATPDALHPEPTPASEEWSPAGFSGV